MPARRPADAGPAGAIVVGLERTGADLLCETLLAQGVDHCFANPGTSEMHFVAALDRVRHEDGMDPEKWNWGRHGSR